MHAHLRPVLVGGVAAIAINALAVAPVASAAPEPGGIPLRFIRNQLQYCGVICPSAVRGAVEIPISIAAVPVTLVDALSRSGSLAQALGATAASLTVQARAAGDPIITNDLELVLPKAQNALQVSLVEVVNVGLAAGQPGQLLQAIEDARSHIDDALDQPIGDPVGPTGAVNLPQVLAVEAVNVGSAVLFQATEAGLRDVVDTADDAAQTLARTGNVAAAASVGARDAAGAVNAASRTVTGSITAAAAHISGSIRDPFPGAARHSAESVAPSEPTGRHRAADDIVHRALKTARDASPASGRHRLDARSRLAS